MPVRGNSEYNDPALGEGFSNLAKIFAPPSGKDVYAYSRAKAEREEADRLAEFFQLAKDPQATREQFDRLGVAAGRGSISTGYHGVDTHARTQLATNAATVAGALEQKRLETEGLLTRQRDLPITVKQNEITNLTPGHVAATGLASQFTGPIVNKPGEITTLPDGTQIKGSDIPLTSDQWKAKQLQTELAAKGINDPALMAAIYGDLKLQPTVGEGGRSFYSTQPQAIGQEVPPDDAKMPKYQVQNYKVPGNTGNKPDGTARLRPDGVWVDSQTGEPIPQGSITYTAALQGDKAGTGLGTPTTANVGSANTKIAENQMTREMLTRYEGIIKSKPGLVGIVGMARSVTQDVFRAAKEAAEALEANPKRFAELEKQFATKLGQKGFDVDISRVEFMRHVLAYRLAKSQDEKGEVNVREMEANLDVLGNGLRANQVNVLGKVGEFHELLNAADRAANTLGGQPGGGPAPAAAPKAETWIRDASGNLVKAP